jgi:CubicO group peptidase (beta-lactamase class C family)
MPTQCISRGSGPISVLQRNPIPVSEFNKSEIKDATGQLITISDWIAKQRIDAILVLRNGRVVTEQYFGGMAPDQPHDLYSAGKSLTSTLIATTLGKELVATNAIEHYLPELKDAEIAGVTIRQLLDMKSGTDYSYSISEQQSELARHMAMTRTAAPGSKPASQWELLKDVKRVRPHGQAMQYKETDVLALSLAAERVTGLRFADLFSQRIWSKLGAEHDAYVRCDGWGTAAPSFGICATCRDLARWGQMCLQEGTFHDQQIVPADFLSDVRQGYTHKVDPRLYLKNDLGLTPLPGTAYRSFFWYRGAQTEAFEACGGFGQVVHVNSRLQTVIVCFSSWMPQDDFNNLDHAQAHALHEISRVVAERLG